MRSDPNLQLNVTIDGDEASEMMAAFAREFGVNMQDYSHDRYFGREGIRDPISTLWGWLTKSSRAKYEPLTVRDLVRAAATKRWPRK